MAYINFGAKEVDINDSHSIIDSYANGFVATRISQGHFEKVRSVRVNLHEFDLSSENRRILRKFNNILEKRNLPYESYSWTIHKLGKEFYDTKFGADTFSANKIKEIFTEKSNNFNSVLVYINPESNSDEGYCICLEASSLNKKMIHYCYPFHKLELINSSFGIYMMTKAIQYFKEAGLDYIYLGSAHTPESKYKLQFKGLEWFDEEKDEWSRDIELLKERIK